MGIKVKDMPKCIPPKQREKMADDPFYKRCIREHEGTCDGRITWEHALIYQGRKIQDEFAIVPLCEFHHSIGIHHEDGDLQKDYGKWVAISRMTNEEKFIKYDKACPPWNQQLKLLENKYGKYGN